MLDLVAYVDGGSLGNPGPAGVGVVIDGAESGRITITKWIGRQDNNVAEYLALPVTNVWHHDASIDRDVASIFDPFGNAVELICYPPGQTIYK